MKIKELLLKDKKPAAKAKVKTKTKPVVKAKTETKWRPEGKSKTAARRAKTRKRF